MNKREIQRFLGAIGYFRRFIPNFSTLALPLTNLLKKDVKFVWDENCNSSFTKLKSILCNYPILRLPDFSKPFNLYIDASGVGIGSCLFQEDAGINYPISYFSKKLTPAQSKYSTIVREAFALVSSVKHFSIYLECGKTTVYTDHNPLTFIHKFKANNAKLLRWSLILSSYDIEIKHVRGVDNSLADWLSRC